MPTTIGDVRKILSVARKHYDDSIPAAVASALCAAIAALFMNHLPSEWFILRAIGSNINRATIDAARPPAPSRRATELFLSKVATAWCARWWLLCVRSSSHTIAPVHHFRSGHLISCVPLGINTTRGNGSLLRRGSAEGSDKLELVAWFHRYVISNRLKLSRFQRTQQVNTLVPAILNQGFRIG